MNTSSGALQERVRVVATANGLLEITMPKRPDWVARIRTVPGRWWHPARLVWTVPDSQESRDTLRDLFAGVLAEGTIVDTPFGSVGTPLDHVGRPVGPVGKPLGPVDTPLGPVGKPSPQSGYPGAPPGGELREPADWDVVPRGWDVAAPARRVVERRAGSVGGQPTGACVQVTRALGYLWLVCLPYVQPWVDWLRSLEGSRWDPGRRSWSVPDTPDTRRRMQQASAELAIVFTETPPPCGSPVSAAPSPAIREPAPGPRETPLSVSPQTKGQVQTPSARETAPLSVNVNQIAVTRPGPAPSQRTAPPPVPPERDCNTEVFRLCDEALRLRAYAPSTKKAYLFHIRTLARFAAQDLRAVDDATIKAYILHMLEVRGFSRQHVNQSISAMKYLYEQVLETPRVFAKIPRSRRLKTLPTVLGRDEVIALIRAVPNIKHRTIVILAYSAGLRVSEVVKLRPEHIDVSRGLITVHQGKGGKDRPTILSGVALEALRVYWKWFQPKGWLFPGGKVGTHLTARSVQNFDPPVKSPV